MRCFGSSNPRKTAKLDALKAWKTLKPDAATVTTMLQALEWQRSQPSWMRDNGQYIPYPASWIRAGRWLDEPEPDDRRVERRQVHWAEECKELHRGVCRHRYEHETWKLYGPLPSQQKALEDVS